MKNLHKIEEGGIPAFIKLVATRWHLNDPRHTNRRIGQLYWDGTYLYYSSLARTSRVSTKDTYIKEGYGDNFKTWVEIRKYISIDLFQSDMIKIVK